MKIGVIGGSGIEDGNILQNVEEIEIETPYGIPSSKIKKGILNGSEVFIISRHGINHEITPTNVNNRANIHSLKQLGCKYILSTTAVGSLRKQIIPGDFLIANQFIDFTKNRVTTFFNDFENGIKHTSLAEPFSDKLRNYLIESCEELGLRHHKIGTILTIEGPRFSTRAESFMFREFAHVVNMSTAPEAILAKEAGVEYAVIAMATDYDCWKKTEKPVTWEEIERIMKKNSDNVKKVLIRTIEKVSKGELVKKDIEYIKSSIKSIPNWPKQGVIYRDITSLMQNPTAMKKVIDILVERYRDKKIDVIAGIESRGFIFGAILAERLNASFVPIRKKGKLPRETETQEYTLEYGSGAIEIHKDAIKPNQKVLIVDDLIATGGTAEAACKLIGKLKGELVECAFIINLPKLKGAEKITQCPMFYLLEFEGE